MMKYELERMSGVKEVLGWNARRIADPLFKDERYLVSFKFRDGTGLHGYFYEVNLTDGIAWEINKSSGLKTKYSLHDAPGLTKDYGASSLPILDEFDPDAFLKK